MDLRTVNVVAGANENLKIVLALLVVLVATGIAIIMFGHLVYHVF